MRRPLLGTFSLGVAAILAAASAAKAQLLIGGFQGPTDPTDAGWTNVNDGDAITADPNSQFVAAGVLGYPLSLEETSPGGGSLPATFGNPSQLQIQLSPAQIVAFNADSYLTFTFSLPTGTATAGYNQIYNINYNASGISYSGLCSGGNAAATWGVLAQAEGDTGSNQSGEPNFYLFPGQPAVDTETVTVNYSSILPAVEAGGEGFVQLIFQGNTGGGSPAIQDFNNVELSPGPFGAASVPEPVSASMIGLASLGLLARRRRIAW